MTRWASLPIRGRLTVAFVRRDGRWLATHTHFSLFPGGPDMAPKPPDARSAPAKP